MSISSRSFGAALLAGAFAAGACSSEPEVPTAQSQTTTAQQLNAPAKLTGCLRAGEAANTFVLTVSPTSDFGAMPATYKLEGTNAGDLSGHVGKRVEVTGIIEEQRHVATAEAPQTADTKATGTAGTPTVQTTTHLALRRVDVKQVRPVADSCE